MVVFENYPLDPAVLRAESRGVRLAGFEVGDATHYPLSLLAIPGERIRFRLDHRADVLDHDGARELLGRLERLLAAFADDPERAVGRLDVLSPAEHDALATWNATEQTAEVRTLPGLFEEQVRRTPDATALTFEGRVLTYRALNARANRIARMLLARGAGPEQIVALKLPRSLDLYAALIAVLKTGAAYLPVDPEYPAERIAYMLEDARPAFVLTERELAEVTDEQSGDDLTDAERTAALTPAHPAYVIYTSGSTGRPKAVSMPGGALANLLSWHERKIPGRTGTVTAQYTSLSFDVAAQEILSALLHGRTLAVPTDEVRRSADALAAWLEAHRVDELYAPNLVIEALAEAALEQGRTLPRLRHLVQAGEALTLGEKVRAFLAAVPGRLLHNHYGPAETHVVTGTVLPADPDEWPAAPPIGRAGRQRARLRAGRLPATGRPRCDGRALPRGRPGGPRLSAPPGADRRAVRGRPLRPRRRPDVPHGRPRPLERGRRAGVRRARRPPGQGARLPHRARRDRERARPTARHRQGRRGRPRGPPRRQAPRRLRGARAPPGGTGPRRPPQGPRPHPAGPHGAEPRS
ncbi:hypothetical protein GCM10020000_76290 [Streptomyces olivoverticillatus]